MRADIYKVSSLETTTSLGASVLGHLLRHHPSPSRHHCTHFTGQTGSDRGHDFPKSPRLENGGAKF